MYIVFCGIPESGLWKSQTALTWWADRVRILKETPEGVKLMCKEMDEIYNWGVKKNIADS